MKPYLYREELAALTPWSTDEIDAMVKRGTLRLGVHYFQAQHRGRRIFKWAAIVELIESGRRAHEAAESVAAHANRKVLDVEKATIELQKLVG